MLHPKQPFMTQVFANCHREVPLQLVLASESAILLSVSALRKFAHQMLHFFQEKYGIVVKHSDDRLTIIRDLAQYLTKQMPSYHFEFIFEHPFTDIHDRSMSCDFLGSCATAPVSREVAILAKRLHCQDLCGLSDGQVHSKGGLDLGTHFLDPLRGQLPSARQTLHPTPQEGVDALEHLLFIHPGRSKRVHQPHEGRTAPEPGGRDDPPIRRADAT
jgi:hypothetical protein